MLPESNDPETIREVLEAAGRRCTRQRRAVFDFLRHAEHDHPTAVEVYQGLKVELPNLSLATVYKALEALIAAGLVTRLAAGAGSARFDARGAGHYHLRCLRTGQVRDLPTPFDPDLVDRLDPGLADRLRDQGFNLTGYRLELVGYLEEPTAADDRRVGG
jgi:Fur family peroxide stress response transcriptional regulator